MPKLIQNAIEIPDGTILISRNTHDYQSKDGYFVDGGLDYCRYGCPAGGENKFKQLFLDEDSTLNELKEKLIWGTRGLQGGTNVGWVKLIDCDTNHLNNILIQIKRRSNLELRVKVIESILEDRYIKTRIKKIKNLIKNVR